MKNENASSSDDIGDTIYKNNNTDLNKTGFPSSSKPINKSKYPKVIVVGGSIGGLCAALALRCINCNVQVFEKSPEGMKSRGAGLVIQMEIINFLKEHDIATQEAVSVPAYKRQYLRKDGTIEWYEPTLQLMTSWDMLYRQLRDVFPNELYHNESKMTSFEQKEDHVIVNFEGNVKEEICDLLVGADGSGSTIRHQIYPEILPTYAGYIAWRGLVNENEVSSQVLDLFSNKFTFFIGKKTHILCYLIPGPNGELSEGRRRLNWVWYVNVPKGNMLNEVLTDKGGILREFSVPYGMVNEDVVMKQNALAENILPDLFRQLIFSTKDPFIQLIYDLSVSKMAFNQVCLIGDASFVVRPHTAASTSKAATNAITLAKSIQQHKWDINTALIKWEPSQLALGNYLMSLGIRLGNNS